MKTRIGFVSNSSSSSFICAICGDQQGGMDVSLDDVEMVEDVFGFDMCQIHLTEDKEFLQKFKQMVIDKKINLDGDEYSKELKDKIIKDGNEDELPDLFENVLRYGDLRWELPAVLSPINDLTHPVPSIIIDFLLHESKSKDQDVINRMKEVYGTYSNFKEALKEGR